MSTHFDSAEGLCEELPVETRDFVFNQTMLRIKHPQRSLDFYTRVLGMRLLRRLDFAEMQFSLYFLGYVDDTSQVPDDSNERTAWTFRQPALLELTHNWGSEDDPELSYHNGNDEPKGFGHIGISVPDVYAACERFEQLGVEFVKKPDAGKMKGLAFIKDPDGYWIEILQANRMRDYA